MHSFRVNTFRAFHSSSTVVTFNDLVFRIYMVWRNCLLDWLERIVQFDAFTNLLFLIIRMFISEKIGRTRKMLWMCKAVVSEVFEISYWTNIEPKRGTASCKDSTYFFSCDKKYNGRTIQTFNQDLELSSEWCFCKNNVDFHSAEFCKMLCKSSCTRCWNLEPGINLCTEINFL